MPLLMSAPAIMPARPAMEPTDRSMPPLRMTNVIPIARMALMATCLTRMVMFAAVRNSGDRTENTIVTATSAITARSRTSTSVNRIALCRIGRGGRRQFLLRHVAAGVLGAYAPSRHDEDAIGRFHDLREVGRRKGDGHAACRERSHRRQDLGLRGDVHAAGRVVEEQHARPRHDAASDHDFLLVAAAQYHDRR